MPDAALELERKKIKKYEKEKRETYIQKGKKYKKKKRKYT
jgi:hypothetical protein